VLHNRAALHCGALKAFRGLAGQDFAGQLQHVRFARLALALSHDGRELGSCGDTKTSLKPLGRALFAFDNLDGHLLALLIAVIQPSKFAARMSSIFSTLAHFRNLARSTPRSMISVRISSICSAFSNSPVSAVRASSSMVAASPTACMSE